MHNGAFVRLEDAIRYHLDASATSTLAAIDSGNLQSGRRSLVFQF